MEYETHHNGRLSFKHIRRNLPYFLLLEGQDLPSEKAQISINLVNKSKQKLRKECRR